MIATECDVPDHPQVEAGKVYIIDFGDSKRLERGPGCQPAVDLPKTFHKHPLAMTRFDPYSWDMYCTGMLLQELLQVCSHPYFLIIQQSHSGESSNHVQASSGRSG